MDELYGGMDCRLRGSMKDSIMMCILHNAMNKAHEKLKSKEGIIERYIEISKFYELAVMQLEGCLKFVQEETETCTLERSYEDVLSDLSIIKDRLQGRLEETELTILNKDRELAERLENELRLRQAFELKDLELISLRAKVELERTKSEELQEFIRDLGRTKSEELHDFMSGNRAAGGDEGKEGEFCELKNSVQQQVWSLKQKIKDRGEIITSGMRHVEPEYEPVDDEKNWNIEKKKIEQMSLDVDNLKQTLDLAFGKMQSAIFLSEPTEQQWRCTVENDTISILTKGFMMDFRKIFEPQIKEQGKSISLFSEHWSYLMNEVTSLRSELEVQLNSIGEKPILPGNDNQGKSDHSSAKVGEVDLGNKNHEEDPEGGDGSHVAKMIKSHESIIRQKSEELKWLKREILREKECSSLRRDKELADLKKGIQIVIVRLDNLINRSAKLGESFGDCRDVHKENFPDKSSSKPDITEKEKKSVATLGDSYEKGDDVSVFHKMDLEQHNELVKIKKDIQDLNLQFMMLEEVYIILFSGLMENFYNELYDFDSENLIREGICKEFFKEMVSECNKDIESNKIEAQIKEEINYVVFSVALKDFGCPHCSTIVKTQGGKAESNLLEDSTPSKKLSYNLEGTMKENICKVFYKEMKKEWKKGEESYNAENLVRGELYQIVFDETVKTILNTAENFLYDVPSTSELFQSVESMVKEEVYMVLFREMMKEWKTEIDDCNAESLIKEDIYHFVIVEAFKDASMLFRGPAAEDCDKSSEDMLSTNKCNETQEVFGEDSLILELNSILECFEREEDFMLNVGPEIKELNVHLGYMGLEQEEMGELTIFEDYEETESTFSLVSSKLEKTLQQLAMSKTLLSDLGSGKDITVRDVQKVPNHRIPTMGIIHDNEESFCLPKENEEAELSTPSSMHSPLMGFPQVFEDFEHTVHKKIERNMLRLEEVTHQSEVLVEFGASLRKKEILYKKAFTRRCHNLHKAETEVDLLGDQVDVLLGLLEKIYTTLYPYSPLLQPYFGVSDILNLIKKELTVGAAHITN